MTVTAFAATVGLGAGFGLFGVTEPDSPVGRLDPRRPATVEVHATPAAVPVTTTPPGANADD